MDEDERTVIPALAARGVAASPYVWDDPAVRWEDHALVVIRSTWDYAERRDAFVQWTRSIPRVLNPPQVIAWNTDKSYLRELAAAGIPVVPTTWIFPGTSSSTIEWPEGEVVVKPAISGGARNTSRYRVRDRTTAISHVEGLLAGGRAVMLQPYVQSVDSDGETGLIYLDGAFSHAIRKGPVLREQGLATTDLFALEQITPRHPKPDERALAEDTLDALAGPRSDLLYARVDVIHGQDGVPLLLELELTEPSLFLSHGDGAAERFAAGIVRRL